MGKLSVIMPLCNEYPQVIFTVRGIAEEFRGRCDFEIIAINNFVPTSGHENEDKGAEMLVNASQGQPWLRVLKYDKKLSHWNAKNFGITQSEGDVLFFADAHTMPSRDSLYPAYEYFRTHQEAVNGTLHMPLSYHILEWRRLMYKLNVDLTEGRIEYAFTPMKEADEPFKIPAMSTCGMFMSKALYNEIGGWPEILGAWGGGENFVNFILPTLGKDKWIWPHGCFHHHGEKRGYRTDMTDILTNRLTACYLVGGEELAKNYIASNLKTRRISNKIVAERMLYNVLSLCYDQRQMLKGKQVVNLAEWLKRWEG